jgi:HK97 family phage major capsid protein
MAKSHELKKKAEELYRNIKDLYSKAETTPEDDAKFDQWNKEYDGLMAKAKAAEDFEKKEIIDAEEHNEVEKTLKKGDLTPEKQREVFNVALKEYYLKGTISGEARDLFQRAKAEKDDKDFITREYEKLGMTRAAQQSTTDGSGGYTIPQGFQAELEKALLDFGGIQEAARIWRTTSGNTVDWPKVDDTMNRAYLIGEAVNAETSAVKITDANQQFEAYKITSGMLRLSSEIVEDSAFDMVSIVSDFLAERMGRGINYYGTVADGSSKPKGITVAAAHGNNTADDATLLVTDFLNLEHEVGSAYRRRGAKWMFHDSVLKEVKRVSFAATIGFPLWVPSFRDGAPSTILGYPYIINDDMHNFIPGSTTLNDSAKVALFGDFKKFILRYVNRMRLVRLVERFGDTDEIALCAFWRFDTDLLDAGTHPVKYMRTPAT